MIDGAPEITVRDNTESGTYDALIDGQVVGCIVYENQGSRMVFSHTIVEPGFRDRGVATKLATVALDDLRAKGKTLTNYCTFIGDFIDAHPEYADLIDGAHPGHPGRG
jgi:uncharacterized protein